MSFSEEFLSLRSQGQGQKLKLGLTYDAAQLDHGRNLCAKFELLPAYGHRDLARTKWQPPAHPPTQLG